MPRCSYRPSPRVDPQRTRCGLEEGHGGPHVPVRQPLGRPSEGGTRTIPVRVHAEVYERYERAPDPVKRVARERAAGAFSRALTDGKKKKAT